MLHMSKCFQAIGKLKLDNDAPPPGQRPKALGMVSCVGEEYVPFKTPLPLVDKVRIDLCNPSGIAVCCSNPSTTTIPLHA